MQTMPLVRTGKGKMSNQIIVIAPCQAHGTWVFDDEAVGLMQESFVSGVPGMIDTLVQEIPNARESFRLLFSTGPFPGYQKRINWIREETGGNWYRSEEDDLRDGCAPLCLDILMLRRGFSMLKQNH